MITAEDLPRSSSVADLMTEQERDLFYDPQAWVEHGSAAFVERGAAFLDRVMPGWEDHVSIKELDLSDTCRCVLGQLFESVADRHEGTTGSEPPYVSGYTGAIRMMGMGAVVAVTGEVGEKFIHTAEEFFGFDHSGTTSYNELTQAWIALLERRAT